VINKESEYEVLSCSFSIKSAFIVTSKNAPPYEYRLVSQLDATTDCDDKLRGNIGLILASTFVDSTLYGS
jgi:hypothetical protein